MSDLFGNSTLPGWQMFTPQSYALAAAPANAEIGRSFAQSFQAAKQNALTKDKMAQDAQQFRDKYIEDRRQFDILHPDPTKPWNAAPITAPPISTPPVTAPNAPATPYSPGYDQQFKPRTFGFLGFADGGRPAVGEPAIVGERGPEVFVPDRPGTVVPNEEVGMAYDRNGTGNITPTPGSRWDGNEKPTWMTAPPAPSWRATNALDAIGKVMQATTFDELSKITAANPEGVMYPQFQNALAEKSQILQRGESITLRQKQIENNSVAAKAALDLTKRFNDSFLALPDEFHVAVRALGEAAQNKDGTPSPAALAILHTGQKYVEMQAAEKAKAAKLVPTKVDATGKTTYGLPPAGSEGGNFGVHTFYDENGKPTYEALVDSDPETGKIRKVHNASAINERVPAEVKAQQENNKSQIEAVQKELSAQMKIAQSTSATDTDKTSATKAALASRAQLQKLWDERVKLSTNWMNKGSAPATKPETAKGSATNAPTAEATAATAPNNLPKLASHLDADALMKQAERAIAGYTNSAGVFVPPANPTAVRAKLKATLEANGYTLQDKKK